MKSIDAIDMFPDYKKGLERIFQALQCTNNEPIAESTNSSPPVFLAEVTDDLDERREQLKQYLKQQGFHVVPQEDLSFDDDESCKNSMSESLKQSKLFVQLLGKFPGKRNLCRKQYNVAEEAKKEILSWRSPDLEIKSCKDKLHQELLSGENVRAENFEYFKAHVVERAKRTKRVKALAQEYEMSGLMIYLYADPVDQDQANDIINFLKKKKMSVTLPIDPSCDEGKNESRDKDFNSCIEDSNGIIFVYGKIDIAALRKKLRLCNGLIYRNKNGKRPALAVYLGKPDKKNPYNIFINDLKEIDCRENLDENQFLPFFEDLNKQGEQS